MAFLPYPRCQPRGCSSLCCTKQLLLLPRMARNAQNLRAEKGLPRMAQIDTDGWGALFSHRIQNTEFGSVGMAGMPYPPTSVNIRAHLWESLLYQKVPCVPCVLWEYLFSHGCHGSIQIVRCAVLPQNSRNSQNLAAWVWQECHTLLICEHPCSSVGGSSLPEVSVRSVRSAGISFLTRMAQIYTDSYGALFSHGMHGIHRIWQRGYGRDAIPS